MKNKMENQKLSKKQINEAAKQYAKNVLGEEQFSKNKDAVKAIITDFKEAVNWTINNFNYKDF
jgi:hypothetical protein